MPPWKANMCMYPAGTVDKSKELISNNIKQLFFFYTTMQHPSHLPLSAPAYVSSVAPVGGLHAYSP